MDNKPRKITNSYGSKIEVFKSGPTGKYAFVFFRSNGDSFASNEDLDEDRVRELIELFDRDEIKMLRRFNPDKYPSRKMNWPVVILCGSIFLSAFYLSNFDWKLALMMALPAALIIIKSHKR